MLKQRLSSSVVLLLHSFTHLPLKTTQRYALFVKQQNENNRQSYLFHPKLNEETGYQEVVTSTKKELFFLIPFFLLPLFYICSKNLIGKEVKDGNIRW